MSEKANILMVDDQPAKLLSYEAILGDLGENLIKAKSGREALEQLLKHDIAVVLLDVSMPEIDGFELADMMRQHPRFQKTAIIFISGIHLSDPDRIKGYQSGAVDYISVPVVPELASLGVRVAVETARRISLTDTETTHPAVVADLTLSGHIRRFGVGYVLGVYNVIDRRYDYPTSASYLSKLSRQNGRTFLVNINVQYP